MSRPVAKPASLDSSLARLEERSSAPERRPRDAHERTGEHPVAAIDERGVLSSTEEDGTEITTQWMSDGWLVVSKWHRASIGSVLSRCGDVGGEHSYRVREEDDTWSFMNDRERVTVTASEDGRAFTEHWEMRGDDGAWYPLCDVTGTRIEATEIDA
jgi:hypothetical protein